MANKGQVIVGLDIGTNTTTVVVGEVLPEGKISILGVGSSPSYGLRKGVVINIDATVDSISQAVSQAEVMSGVEISAVFAAVSGSHIKGLNSHGIVGIKNKEVSNLDVEKVIDAAKAVAIPMDREVLHVLPQEFIIDEQDGIREPVGISGVRLEARVHIVTGAVATAENIVKCANRCGLSVRDIVLAALASARAVLTQEEQDLGVALIDIGGGTTDIIVMHAGAVKHTSVIPLGGAHITNDIAAGLRTPNAAAEDIKRRFGTAVLGDNGDDDTIEVPSTGGRSCRVLSRRVLFEIVEPRVAEILNWVQRDLIKSGCYDMLTSGLVLTGGTANLGGIVQLAEQTFNLPVRVGAPIGVLGLTDLIKSPEYSTGVGLIVQGAAQATSRGSYSAGSSAVRKVFRRVANWFGEYF